VRAGLAAAGLAAPNGAVKNILQPRQVPLERPRSGCVPCTCTQPRQDLGLCNASDDGVCQRFRTGTARGRQASVLSVGEPFGNAPRRERHRRDTVRGCFKADQTEWFGPNARYYERVSGLEQVSFRGPVLPANKYHLDPRLSRTEHGRDLLQTASCRTLPCNDKAQATRQPLHRDCDGSQETIQALQGFNSSHEQQGARRILSLARPAKS